MEEIQAKIYVLLGRIAPEADLDTLTRRRGRAALDIDSFDLLMLLIDLNKAFGVDIPERDYGQLTTVRPRRILRSVLRDWESWCVVREPVEQMITRLRHFVLSVADVICSNA
ncbi:MAG: acyl carrier protein [Caldilineaceae bacterium]